MTVNLLEIDTTNLQLFENGDLEITFDAMVGVFPKKVIMTTKNGNIINFNPAIEFDNDEAVDSYLKTTSRILNHYFIVNDVKVDPRSGSYTEFLSWFDKNKQKNLAATFDIEPITER